MKVTAQLYGQFLVSSQVNYTGTYLADMLADFAERLTTELAGSRAANALQVYRSSIQHLRDFEKYSRWRYDFTAINLEFHNK